MNRRTLVQFGPLIALILLLIIAMIWQPGLFLKGEALLNLVNQNVSVGIIAIGMTIVIAVGAIDLSVGSLMALAAALMLVLINQLVPGSGEVVAVTAGAIVSMLLGAILGLVNGLLVTLGRLAPFIATLGGLAAYRSLALVLANGGEIRSSSNEVFSWIGQGGIPLPFLTLSSGRPLLLTWGILLFLVMAILGHFVLTRTKFGRHGIAVGANEKAARYSAINTQAIKLGAFTIVGFCAGLAGLIEAARFNSVPSSQMGLYYELDAIAAVVIGGTSMAGGRATIWGTVVGVLILGVINMMLVGSGISPNWQGAVKGAIILLAVLVQRGKAEED